MKKLLRSLLLLLTAAALLGWGIRELFPKTDETESLRLRAELDVAQDSSRVRGERADAKTDTLESTRLAFEADTTAHTAAVEVAVAAAHGVGARLRATQTAEQNARLDSLETFYEVALMEAENKATTNADRLRETEEALVLMTGNRDDWKQTATIADSLATENWDLYQTEKRRSLFNILDLQCTAGATAIYGTKGPDFGAGITCGIGR